MKKILICTDTFLPRMEGITRFLLKIKPELEKNYEVKLIAPDFGTEKTKGNIIRVPSYNFQVADLKIPKFNFLKVFKHVRDSDIVFVHSIGPIGMSAIIWGAIMRKKLIAYSHIIEWEVVIKAIAKKGLKKIIKFLSKVVSRFFYNLCDLILVPSKNISEKLKKNKIKTKKEILPLGIDTKEFVPSENKKKSKEKIDISGDKNVIGYVGRLAREKDLRTLYRAFTRVKNKNPETILLIVGEGIEEVKSIFKDKSNVVMTGMVKDVVPYLQAMDIYVLPSLTETSSLSTLEAMSCELPVVVTKVGYVKEYVKDGKNGLFFEKKNNYELYKKIGELLGNKEKREKLGKKARETILNKFKWRKTVEKLNGILEKLD